MGQIIADTLSALTDYIAGRRFLLVCDAAYPHLALSRTLDALPHATFADFTPNPLYEQVCTGVELFRASGCKLIVAVGGGSAMDVAKCIKLYSGMDPTRSYLTQEMRDTGIPLAAVPTTAGTGSESTRHAVIYAQGVKQSISHPAIVPDFAALLPEVLATLPLYQKKCTMLDALCQAIESWWSASATPESIAYSREAITAIRDNWRAYIFNNDADAAAKVMRAANLAGRAINITATTAAHAMSYKLTSLYHLPHGHAVAVCMTQVWPWLNAHAAEGPADLAGRLADIAALADEAWFDGLLHELDMAWPVSEDKTADLRELTASVNPVRLRNMPVVPDAAAINEMYERIVRS